MKTMGSVRSVLAFLLVIAAGFASAEYLQQNVNLCGWVIGNNTDAASTFSDGVLTQKVTTVYKKPSGAFQFTNTICSVASYPKKGLVVEHWMLDCEGTHIPGNNNWDADGTLKWADTDGKEQVVYNYGDVSTDYVNINVAVRFRYLTYSIKYVGNGGVWGEDQSPVDHGSIDYTQNKLLWIAPIRTGYTFAGWKSGSGEVFAAEETVTGASFSGLDTVHDDDRQVVLSAQWKPRTFLVTFNAAGGSVSVKSKTVTYDSVYGELPIPVREGYTFMGWYNSDKEPVTADTVVEILSGITLSALWEAESSDIKLMAYGDTPGTKSVAATIGESMPPVTVPQIVGYTFKGYYTGDFSKQYYTEDGKGVGVCDLAKGATLYPLWEANTYTVTLDQQGGGNGSTSVSYVYERSRNATYTLPSRTGYIFGGYFTEKNGKGTQYGLLNGKLLCWEPRNVTLYAHWTPIPYSLAFDAAGGQGNMLSVDRKYDTGTFTLPVNTFTKTGYTFRGWAKSLADATAGVIAYGDGAEVDALASDANVVVTLYAVWAANQYVVHFDFDRDTYAAASMTGTMEDQIFYYDAPQKLQPNAYQFADKPGEVWHFTGWSDGNGVVYADEQQVSNLTVQANGEITLYAMFRHDFGELSAAMGCDNLKWENDEVKNGSNGGWVVASNVQLPDGSIGDCVMSKYADGEVFQVLAMNCALSEEGDDGELSFWWKSTDVWSEKYVRLGDESLNLAGIEAVEERNGWRKVLLEANNIKEIEIWFRASDDVESCYISGMTWVSKQ